jgi:hypothetical protein
MKSMLGPERWEQVKQFIMSRIGGGQPQPGQPAQPTSLDQASKPAAPATMGLVPLKDYLEQKKGLTVPGSSAAVKPASDEVPAKPTSLGQAYTQLAQNKPDQIDEMLKRADQGKSVERPGYFGSKKTPAAPAAPPEPAKETPNSGLTPKQGETENEMIDRLLGRSKKTKKEEKAEAEVA